MHYEVGDGRMQEEQWWCAVVRGKYAFAPLWESLLVKPSCTGKAQSRGGIRVTRLAETGERQRDREETKLFN